MGNFVEKILELFYPDADRCPVCSGEGAFGLCPRCRAELEEVYVAKSGVYRYDGIARNIVRRYKFEGEKHLGDIMARLMKPHVRDADIITNVPVHKKRRRERGFDQSQVLAKKLSLLTGIPYVCLIEKRVNTRPQSSLTKEERLINVKDKYAAISDDIRGKVIVLVDDVITTGATMGECRRVLLEAGAAEVIVCSFAETCAPLND